MAVATSEIISETFKIKPITALISHQTKRGVEGEQTWNKENSGHSHNKNSGVEKKKEAKVRIEKGNIATDDTTWFVAAILVKFNYVPCNLRACPYSAEKSVSESESEHQFSCRSPPPYLKKYRLPIGT